MEIRNTTPKAAPRRNASCRPSAWGLVLAISLTALVGCGGGGGGGGGGAGGGNTQPSFAFAANDSDSTVSIFTVDPADGTLDYYTYQNVGTSSSRDVVVLPGGEFVLVLGTGDLFSFRVDAQTGELTAINDRPTGSNPDEITISSDGRFAYVNNINSDTISAFAIDPTDGSLSSIGSVATGDNPVDLVVHPNGEFLYSVNRNDQDVSVFDIAADGSLSGQSVVFSGSSDPTALAFSLDGERGYLTLATSSNNVVELDVSLASGGLGSTGTVSAGNTPVEIAIDSEGANAYVLNSNGDSVTRFRIDEGSGDLTSPASIGTGSNPDSIAFGPSETTLYVGSRDDSDVTAISIDTGGSFTFRGTIRARGGVRGVSVKAGNGALDRSSRQVYVPIDNDAKIEVFNRAASTGLLTFASEVNTGLGVKQITFHPRRDLAYAVCSDDSELELFAVDPTSGALTSQETFTLPQDGSENWSRVAIDPSGRFLYALDSRQAATDNGRVARYTIENDGSVSFVGIINTGDSPENFVISPSGRHLYVLNSFADAIVEYEINASSGSLTVNTTFGGIDRPLQAVFHPSGEYLYVTMQNEQSVYRFRIQENGSLSNAQDFQKPSPSNTKAVAVHPSGDFLYSSAVDGTLTRWLIDNNGLLTYGGEINTGESNWLGISEDGSHLYGADSDQVDTFELDATGTPTLIDSTSTPGLDGFQRTLTVN